MNDEKLVEIAIEAGIEADMGELRWFYEQIMNYAAGICEDHFASDGAWCAEKIRERGNV